MMGERRRVHGTTGLLAQTECQGGSWSKSSLVPLHSTYRTTSESGPGSMDLGGTGPASPAWSPFMTR